jgi:DNA polymerase III epsilon subunit-like protein
MSTPRGKFDFILAIDCETTGLCFSPSPTPVYNPDTGEHHQSLSWGIIVADATTLKPVEELYVEIKWNKLSIQQRELDPEFGKKAESIHQLTYDYLEKHGITEEEAVIEIGKLILKYWGPDVSVKTLGHNVHMFDVPFLKELFDRYGISLKFGNRHIDSNSIGFGTIGSFNSDDLFSTMGLEERGTHNSLEDARMALESVRRIKMLWEANIGVKAYDTTN